MSNKNPSVYLPPPPGQDFYPEQKKPFPLVPAILGAVVLLAGLGATVVALRSGKNVTGPVSASAEAAGSVPMTSARVPAVAAPVMNEPVPDYGSDATGAPGLVGKCYNLLRKPDGAYGDSSAQGGEAVEAFADRFMKGGFDERTMDAVFWRAPKALATGRILFPPRTIDEVTALFGVSKADTKAQNWAFVYRGKVQAPMTGEIRLIAFAGERLLVRFAGAPVLDAQPYSPIETSKVRMEDLFSYNFGKPPEAGKGEHYLAGPWFKVEAGKVYDLECALLNQNHVKPRFYLLWESHGAQHPVSRQGCPVCDFFRVFEEPPIAPKGGLVTVTAGLVFPVVKP